MPIRLAPGGEPVGCARGLHELRRRRAGDPRGRAAARAAAGRRPRAALRHAVPDRRRAPRGALRHQAAARRADRPAEPHPAAAPRRARAARRRPGRDAADRPRPLQGGQRHARARLRRRAAGRGRRAPRGRAAARRHARAARRRRVRRARRRGARPRPPSSSSPRGCRTRCGARSRSAASPSSSRRASASPSTRSTGRRSAGCSSAPTSRCTTPSAAAAASSTYTAERDPYSADRLGLLAELRTCDRARRAGAALPAEGLRWRRASSPASRRSCAGSTRPAACSLPTPSSRSPSAPARSPTSPAGWSTTRSPSTVPGATRGIDLPIAVNLAAANIVDVTLPDAIGELLRALRRSRRPARVRDLRAHRDGATRCAPAPCWTGCASSASACRSTTSAPATRRCPTSSGCRSTRSRSTARSWPGWRDDENDAVIVRSTIDLARNLGLRVVAEGVETAEIMDALSDAALRHRAGLPHLAAAAGRRARAWLAPGG